MHRLYAAGIALLSGALFAAAFPLPIRAQEQYQYETDLLAKRRVFDAAGPGFRTIRRGPNGNYYVLIASPPAVEIYDAAGARVGQIPGESASKIKEAALVYGESFDVDPEGRVAVCDRGANAVKLYAANGSLLTTISVPAPESVVFLPGSEMAVASPSTEHLVTVYDLTGKTIRDYGDREEIAERADINNQVNFGHLAADAAGNTYFSFDYMPEPTVRKFDHAGYLALEISLATLEFEPAAQAARKAMARSETGVIALHRIISAVGVAPESQEVWMAIGTLLMHFDKDGRRLASFRLYSPEGSRLEPSMILVEPDRLLIGADPLGIYEFPKPPILPR
ncbi:MAG: hypothetical protein ACRD4Y_17850 [Candidatus Acidiferrales bacterium]